ncbi:MAG: hypothetical protein NTW59_00045 [Candidatus Diapherotrites archaeon]|nr:hypothetical protein [Candidatus Diapherotrites archaeon]
MKEKAQAGLDYLLTYGWAFILVMSVLGLIFFLVSGPTGQVSFFSSDSGQILVKGGEIKKAGGADAVSMVLQNSAGAPISITGVFLDDVQMVSNEGGAAPAVNGTLFSALPLDVPNGGQITISGVDFSNSNPEYKNDVRGGIRVVFNNTYGYTKTVDINAAGKIG